MSSETQPPVTTKLCPTCGTRLGINATRCSICGSTQPETATNAAASAPGGSSRVPVVRLSLPVFLAVGLLLMAVAGGTVFAMLSGAGRATPVASVEITVTETLMPTASATILLTQTSTMTATPQPSPTPEPPLDYKVSPGDMCWSIAATFNVSMESIVRLNGINCELLVVGQELKIPRPTLTPSPEPTATLNATQIAAQDCERIDYLVKEGDTLGYIAGNYAVSMASVRAYNALPSDIVYVGQKLIIPLCEQMLETATPTPIPPYPAPNLLLPVDGTVIEGKGEVVTLQWSSVGTLRQNEAYAVFIENITLGDGRAPAQYVTDTKFIIPEEFRPAGGGTHIYRWSVIPVRQVGTEKDSEIPIWEPAGAASPTRVFSWNAQ
jgi:LysM repeat protein